MSSLEQTDLFRKRVEQLTQLVEKGDRALICTHDNPDPDSIASAFALGRLLEACVGCEYVLTYGGVLGRAENIAMVKTLKVPLVPISKVELEDFAVVGLVDTQPEVGNHSLPKGCSKVTKLICIDHHPAREESKDAAFADVGGDFGSTSTLLTAYLHAAGVPIDTNLASALFYGVKSDTRDLGREVNAADVWAYTHLAAQTDMALVSAIEHPKLPRSYFSVLVRAIQKAQVWDAVVATDLGPIYVPDLVPETADRLLSAQGMRWSIVVGEHEDQVYVSIRVSDRRCSAGKLVRDVIQAYPNGSAGGHGSMAGARIPYRASTKSKSARTRYRKGILHALLRAAGVHEYAEPEPFAAEDMSMQRAITSKWDKRSGEGQE